MKMRLSNLKGVGIGAKADVKVLGILCSLQ